jgi:predicted P-loop ATPase/GTPase
MLRERTRLCASATRLSSHQAVVLTNEPEERLVKKLFKALCAEPMSPELNAEPISESSLVNDAVLEVLELLELELSEVLLVVELESEFSKLVKES